MVNVISTKLINIIDMATRKGKILSRPDYMATMRAIKVGTTMEYTLCGIREYNSLINAKCRLQKETGALFEIKTADQTRLLITRLS